MIKVTKINIYISWIQIIAKFDDKNQTKCNLKFERKNKFVLWIKKAQINLLLIQNIEGVILSTMFLKVNYLKKNWIGDEANIVLKN